ncbi:MULTISPECIES: Tll0287-like domain-containing protein [Deefgea]|uniref:DUF3365 domain-containing protein n=1 Tax=Deefgea chitinilytica TaxID=570276 RepID=A0ABS2C8W2_9NEIS|nr:MULTISPECIES: DUF3365 domain-containing protein [Deefgea]MBM5570472.1 DUF3365 domain-containing protein [Deefgea chitinilytica]MBM9887701.1 DUF3365 domain-containing protein [Deefgea sp. CFH1-16]
MAERRISFFSIVLIMALLCVTIYASGEAIYRNQAVAQARTVADMVENIGKWASTFGGMWIKNNKGKELDLGSHLDTMIVTPSIANSSEISSSEADEIIQFHLKNPALIQREISDFTEKSSSTTKFRITSDKFMNPKNAPTGFETTAMNEIRKNNSKEFYTISDGQLRYARALVATEACMRCHDTPAKAPASVRDLYPNQGYGYEVGKVSGVISVTVPYTFSLIELIKDLSLWFWLAVSALVVTILSLSRKKTAEHLND